MKLWLISQTANKGYDTFDSAVVAAEDEDRARLIHPAGYGLIPVEDWKSGSWVNDASLVEAKFLGVAELDQLEGVICASFNAG